MERSSLWDRFVAITSYYTFGLTGLVWIVASYLIFKTTLTRFTSYHIYQSIFISILLAVFTMAINFIFDLVIKIPFIGHFLASFYHYVFGHPVFYTFSLFHFVLFALLTYLSLGAFLGKLSYFPFISDVIKANFGGR